MIVVFLSSWSRLAGPTVPTSIAVIWWVLDCWLLLKHLGCSRSLVVTDELKMQWTNIWCDGNLFSIYVIYMNLLTWSHKIIQRKVLSLAELELPIWHSPISFHAIVIPIFPTLIFIIILRPYLFSNVIIKNLFEGQFMVYIFLLSLSGVRVKIIAPRL